MRWSSIQQQFIFSSARKRRKASVKKVRAVFLCSEFFSNGE